MNKDKLKRIATSLSIVTVVIILLSMVFGGDNSATQIEQTTARIQTIDAINELVEETNSFEVERIAATLQTSLASAATQLQTHYESTHGGNLTKIAAALVDESVASDLAAQSENPTYEVTLLETLLDQLDFLADDFTILKNGSDPTLLRIGETSLSDIAIIQADIQILLDQ